MRQILRFLLLFTIPLLLWGAGCIHESDTAIREKLRVILEDDLQTILSETPQTSHAPNSRYVLTSYMTYNEGNYSRKAEVDFYFLKGVRAKIARKYRYVRDAGKWERYVNEYRFYQNAADSIGSH